MRAWNRVAVPTFCGSCRALIPAEDPALFITLPGVKRVKIRCQECEGAAPADLPELVKSTVPKLEDMDPIAKIAAEFQGVIWKRG
jgi:hypothetical protein